MLFKHVMLCELFTINLQIFFFPNSRKSFMNKQKIKKNNFSLKKLTFLPNLHSFSASPTYPSRHVQTIVRRGSESTTEQTALAPHGLVSKQGFLHSPLKHASLLGQSASILQLGSTFSGIISQDLEGFPVNPGGHRQDGT